MALVIERHRIVTTKALKLLGLSGGSSFREAVGILERGY
jgi:hypothetical protein